MTVEGTGVNGVLLLFQDEAERRHWKLQSLLRRAGLNRDDFLLADCPSSSLEVASLVDAHPQVRVVVPMGPVPHAVTSGRNELERYMLRGVPYVVGDRQLVRLPLLSPVQLLVRRGVTTSDDIDDSTPEGIARAAANKVLHNPARFTGLMVIGLHRALKYAREGLPPQPIRHYLKNPPLAVFKAWVDQALAAFERGEAEYLSFDLETDYHLRQRDREDQDEGVNVDAKIIRISFAWKPHHAVSVPAEGFLWEQARRLLRADIPKLGWNSWNFDEPVLRANGEELNGVHYDGQDAFHVWQSDLPKGLEPVSALFTVLEPWKHLSDSDPALYSCIDADAALQNFLGVKRELEREGRWQHYLDQYVDLHPVLVRASDQGAKIDIEEQAKLAADYEAILHKLLREAQDMVADSDKQWKDYVRLPKGANPDEWAEVTVEREQRRCSACGRLNINRRHACKVQPDGWTLEKVKLPTKAWRRVRLPAGCSLKEFKDWLRSNGFNPNSSKQMIAYMKRHGHPLGTNYKSKADSADTKHLQKLASKYGAKHPIYAQAIEIHKVMKALSTYIDGMKPDKDGFIHTTYTNAPSTGRLSSRNPNLQNCYAGDVEVLTPDGWVRFDQLVPGVKVMAVDLAGNAEFQEPTAYHRVAQPIVRFEAEWLGHLDVTADHDMVIGNRKDEFTKVPAYKLAERVARVKIPDFRVLRGVHRLDGLTVTPETWRTIEQAICIQAEGHVVGRQVIIRVRSDRKRDQLVELFGADAVVWKEGDRCWQVNVRDYAQHSTAAWLDYVGVEKRFRLDQFLRLDSSTLAAVLDELMRWDGDFTRKASFLSSEPSAVELAQLAAVLSGKSTKWATYKNRFPVVHVHRSAARWASRMDASYVGVGDAYGVTVPSGCLLVRTPERQVLVSGNCGKRNTNLYAKKARRIFISRYPAKPEEEKAA